jgi:hypothetical protein
VRFIVVNESSDLLTLSRTLFNDGGNSTGNAAVHNATLDRIKSLNPQVDFSRMEAGTVLLLPDTPDLKDSASQSIAGDAFADFASHLTEGLGTAAQRVSSGTDALVAEREAVTAMLTTDAVKRQVESDPLLEKQLEAASEALATEQEEMREAAKQVQTMQVAVANEMAVLAKLLR